MKTRDGLTPRDKAATVLFLHLAEKLKYLEEDSLSYLIDVNRFSEHPVDHEDPVVAKEIYQEIRCLMAPLMAKLEELAYCDDGGEAA